LGDLRAHGTDSVGGNNVAGQRLPAVKAAGSRSDGVRIVDLISGPERARVYLALGGFAYAALAAVVGLWPRPRFGHGTEALLPDGRTIICSFHPSQQNTFTGKLTEPMLDAVVRRAVALSAGTGGGR